MSKKCLRLGTENLHIEAVPKEIFLAYPGQDQIDTKVSQNTRFYNCNTSSQRFPHQSRLVRFTAVPGNFEILGLCSTGTAITGSKFQNLGTDHASKNENQSGVWIP